MIFQSHRKNSVPESFYCSNFTLVRTPQLSYTAYCSARDKWVNSLPVPNNSLILDIGCSNGEAFSSWTNSNTVIGVDHAEKALDCARENGIFPFVGDLQALPFNEETFDCVCALGVLGVFDDTASTLAKFTRVLKQGGTLYLSVATLGGVRLLTRSFVKLFGIKNQMAYIPRVSTLEKDIRKSGVRIESTTVTPLFPTTTLYANPTWVARTMGAYSFIKATKL